MFSKLPLLVLAASAAFTIAAPADTHRAIARQDEYNFWKLQLFTQTCNGEPDEEFSGTNDQTFPCTGSVTGWHNVKMDSIAENGLKVLLYSDGGCLNQIGEVNRDGTCYSAPTDSVISAYAIVKQ